MMNKMLYPRVIGIAHRRCTVLPALVLTQAFPAPIAHVERRVGDNVIGFQIRMQVTVERVRVLLAEIALDPADRKVHLRQFPRGWVALLPKNADVVPFAA